jgi:hypothetical protein
VTFIYKRFARFIVALLALAPTVFAVSPLPDGGYANQNTAEGEDALFSFADLSFYNTAIGFDALYSATVAIGILRPGIMHCSLSSTAT